MRLGERRIGRENRELREGDWNWEMAIRIKEEGD